jgi:hypothetical protein
VSRQPDDGALGVSPRAELFWAIRPSVGTFLPDTLNVFVGGELAVSGTAVGPAYSGEVSVPDPLFPNYLAVRLSSRRAFRDGLQVPLLLSVTIDTGAGLTVPSTSSAFVVREAPSRIQDALQKKGRVDLPLSRSPATEALRHLVEASVRTRADTSLRLALIYRVSTSQIRSGLELIEGAAAARFELSRLQAFEIGAVDRIADQLAAAAPLLDVVLDELRGLQVDPATVHLVERGLRSGSRAEVAAAASFSLLLSAQAHELLEHPPAP